MCSESLAPPLARHYITQAVSFPHFRSGPREHGTPKQSGQAQPRPAKHMMPSWHLLELYPPTCICRPASPSRQSWPFRVFTSNLHVNRHLQALRFKAQRSVRFELASAHLLVKADQFLFKFTFCSSMLQPSGWGVKDIE